MNLYLIGYRGVGKSEVGRLLSIALNRGWLDMDDELAREIRSTIREFVARFGWPAFRREEKRLLSRVCLRDNLVVSTGGGVVLDADNVADMRNSGRIIWLRAAPETIWKRLTQDLRSSDTRPPLTSVDDSATEIRETLSQRMPVYQQAANLVIDTDNRSVTEVCRALVERLALGNLPDGDPQGG